MAADEVILTTPMVPGEQRVIAGEVHTCVKVPARYINHVVKAAGLGCTGCPQCRANGRPCDALFSPTKAPLCGFPRLGSSTHLHRVYPLTIIAALALRGVEFDT